MPYPARTVVWGFDLPGQADPGRQVVVVAVDQALGEGAGEGAPLAGEDGDGRREALLAWATYAVTVIGASLKKDTLRLAGAAIAVCGRASIPYSHRKLDFLRPSTRQARRGQSAS